MLRYLSNFVRLFKYWYYICLMLRKIIQFLHDMKKNSLFLAMILMIFGVMMWAQNQSTPIEKRWVKVEEFAGKQLPESALKEVEAILAQAKKEKNSVEIIKAMVYKMRFSLDKNPEEAPALIRDFEAFTGKSNDPAEKALLHSMTAELYAQFYQKDAYTINNRTELKGYVPEDMKEWTKNIYFDKISKHLAASLEHPVVLQHTDALKFAELLEKGDDSRSMQPTLFDFLGYRRIDILNGLLTNASGFSSDDMDSTVVAVDTIPTDAIVAVDTVAVDTSSVAVETKSVSTVADEPSNTEATNSLFEIQIRETYKDLIDFRLKEKNTPALVYVELQQLKFELNHSKAENPEFNYLNGIIALEKKYADNEAVVEVLAEKANYYLNNANNEENKSFKRIAFDICTNGIRQFPAYKRIGLLKNIQRAITQKNISISYNEVVKPTSNLTVKVLSSCVDTILLKVYKVDATGLEYYNFRQNWQNRKAAYSKRTLIETREIVLKKDSLFGEVDKDVTLKTGSYSIYEISVEENKNENPEESAIGSFTVTDFTFMKRMNTPDQASVYVLDRQTGNPLSSVDVRIYTSTWKGNGYALDSKDKVTTNKKGLCTHSITDKNNNDVYFFQKGNDVYFSSRSNSYYYQPGEPENEAIKIDLFTDRSVYRPGQTVYFKGIAYYSNKKRQEVLSKGNYEVSLFNANYQKLSTKKVTTNEFGSFTGQFVLPQGGLNGQFHLEAGESSQFIWVEEYKRPTFEVKIEKPKAEVRFGDKTTITGTVKAFAGYSIGDAKVKYRVVRTNHRYCWWLREPEKEITNGTTITKSDGSFDVSFIPEKTKKAGFYKEGEFYTYTVYSDVTDQKGETQQGEQSVSVGDKSLFIIAEVPEKLNKKQAINIELNTETLNGIKINSIVKYTLYRIENIDIFTEKINDKKVFKESEKVLTGDFDTRTKTLKLEAGKLSSGRYKLVFTTPDAQGKEVKLEKMVILFSDNDKRPPVKSYVWLSAPKTECKPGENASIQFGTSTQNSSVLYELYSGNILLESRWIPFSDEIKNFNINYKDSYGSSVKVTFTFVKDEQFFTRSLDITRKIIEKKLTPTLSVFRNKLLPGEKAEWTVQIPEYSKLKKEAEIMVDMYDASLDAIRPHSWDFNPAYAEPEYYSTGWFAGGFNGGSDIASINTPFNEVNEFRFDRLNWFGLSLNTRMNRFGGMKIRGMSVMSKGNGVLEEVTTLSKMSFADVKGNDRKGSEEKPLLINRQDVDKNKLKNTPPVQIRTNFNETAFFYPQLCTDSVGNVKFTFTAPESLTRWNVKMLVHTKDLYFGQGEAQVVTQKDLMVQMNLPRFVRRSDKLVLSASVINLTDKTQTANVQFEMINPATEKNITLKGASPKTVTLAANETKAVEWEVSEFSPYELVTCKVTARAGDFSDGEQKYLPVLPDKVLVTESMPLTIRNNQTRTFNFESLLKNGSTVESKNLSVEFTSNPAWYAVQALPTLAAPENENAIDYFTAWYVNSLAGYIANSNPKIAATFDQWKKAGGSREALLSNLEKNAELKNMLLEETPWVMAAKDETEQKKQIALLFDLNMQKSQAQQYLDKLISLQMPSGGFSWFKGMPESRYVTQEVILNMGRLYRLTGGNLLASYLLPLTSALKYLDLEIARDFDQLKKNNKNYDKEMSVDNIQLFYLHLRSEYPDIPVQAVAREAVKFYTAQSEKYWTNLTLYGKAMMAVVAHRNGNTQIANGILKSLKENALKTDEFGMYWAKNTPGYFWNEQPVSVQAAIIEAFAEVTKNYADVDEMKIWLLKQKQTQRWNSPLGTVDAIYALLHDGSDWLANSGQVKITLGKTLLQPPTVEAGTGYFKQTIPVNDIVPEMGKVTVSSNEGFTQSEALNKNSEALNNKKSSIGWGAVYWQYDQTLDKVTGQSGPLKITKKLFVEKMATSGKTLLPIEQTQLKKGDKVITRLVITTDRNLDFVALKDLRAACLEPVNQLSGSQWKEGVCYYQTIKDATTQFFFSYLPKGTYVFEYECWANSAGDYSSGIASIQCQYAPEFVSHTGGERISVGSEKR